MTSSSRPSSVRHTFSQQSWGWLWCLLVIIPLVGCQATKTINTQPDTIISPPKNDVDVSTDTPCEPQCTDKQCGDDGCGGSCGTCLGCLGEALASLCNADGTCEQPCCASCEGRECGDDGCGGSCGECPGCNGPAPALCTSLGQCSTACCPNCEGKICGDDGCGGSCGSCGQNMYCNDSGQCADNAGCVPDCVDKQCGSNSCGGVCGDCGASAVCDAAQHCIQIGTVGDACGDVTFHGVCVANQLYYCVNNVLQMVDCVDTDKVCLPTNDGTGFDCQPAPCSANCEGKNCGNDGCGGTCGACGPDKLCVSGVCTAITPCDGVPDSGTCSGTTLKQCINDSLVETDCAADGKVCTIEPQFDIAICQTETCAPQCTNKTCGPDGCGGSCGTCPEGQTCAEDQQCTEDNADSCAGKCDSSFVNGANCQCDAYCFVAKDCCNDLCDVCPTEFATQCQALGSTCATSFTVGPLPFEASKDTTGASADYSFPNDTCPEENVGLGLLSADHVWSFTAPTTDLYLVTLEAQFDSLLYAATSCDITAATCLKADDEIGTGTDEFILIDVNANDTAYIIVDGWSNFSNVAGAYTLKVEYSP